MTSVCIGLSPLISSNTFMFHCCGLFISFCLVFECLWPKITDSPLPQNVLTWLNCKHWYSIWMWESEIPLFFYPRILTVCLTVCPSHPALIWTQLSVHQRPKTFLVLSAEFDLLPLTSTPTPLTVCNSSCIKSCNENWEIFLLSVVLVPCIQSGSTRGLFYWWGVFTALVAECLPMGECWVFKLYYNILLANSLDNFSWDLIKLTLLDTVNLIFLLKNDEWICFTIIQYWYIYSMNSTESGSICHIFLVIFIIFYCQKYE